MGRTGIVEAAFERFDIILPAYVKERMRVCVYPPKSVIVLSGHGVTSIDFLLQGEIQIVNSFSNGTEYGYTNEESFTLLGDIEYFSGAMHYASSVMAKTRVSLAALEFDTFQRWFDRDKVFRDFVVASISKKAFKMAERFGVAKYEDSANRLIRILLDNASPLPDGDAMAVAYSHFELAFMAGMSERTVNRILKKLKQAGLITVRRKAVVFRRSDLPVLGELSRREPK